MSLWIKYAVGDAGCKAVEWAPTNETGYDYGSCSPVGTCSSCSNLNSTGYTCASGYFCDSVDWVHYGWQGDWAQSNCTNQIQEYCDECNDTGNMVNICRYQEMCTEAINTYDTVTGYTFDTCVPQGVTCNCNTTGLYGHDCESTTNCTSVGWGTWGSTYNNSICPSSQSCSSCNDIGKQSFDCTYTYGECTSVGWATGSIELVSDCVGTLGKCSTCSDEGNQRVMCAMIDTNYFQKQIQICEQTSYGSHYKVKSRTCNQTASETKYRKKWFTCTEVTHALFSRRETMVCAQTSQVLKFKRFNRICQEV